MKSQRKNKFIFHLFFLLLLGNSLIAFPNMQVQAATAKTYKVKINRVHKGELVKKKSGWYLQSKTYKITTRAAEKRVVKLTILSKSGLNSGYYYFDSKGKLDGRNKFHYLNTKADGVRFKGMYYFGRSGGRLLRRKSPGWVTINGNRYVLSKMGRRYENCWYDGYYLTKNGQIALDQKITDDIYVDEESRKTIRENLRYGALMQQLQAVMNEYGGNWSVYVKDMKTNDVLYMNDCQMYPASVIKLFVMEATYANAAKNQFALSDYVQSLLYSMITYSDNESFNQLVKINGNGSFAGGCANINEYLRQNGYTGTGVHHTLHPASSSSQSDGGGSNLSTAKDVGGLLERVYRRTAVSEEASAQMWNLLWNQQKRIKIPAGLPSGVISGNKTGETDSYQHDAAIVYGEKTDYVIVVFSNIGEYYGIRGIQRISSLVYNYLNNA